MTIPQTYPKMSSEIVGILREGNQASQYAAQRIVELEAEIARLQAVKAAAIKVVAQTTPDAAYQLHDGLIAAIEAADAQGPEVNDACHKEPDADDGPYDEACSFLDEEREPGGD